MRAMLDRLFAGRNGVDQLNIALLYWQFYFGWLRFFSPTYGFSRLFHGLCLLAAAFCIVRALSRNLGRRQRGRGLGVKKKKKIKFSENWGGGGKIKKK